MEIHLGHYLVQTELLEPDEGIIFDPETAKLVPKIEETVSDSEEKQYQLVGGYDWSVQTKKESSLDLICYICGTSFDNRTFLLSHLRQHKVNSCLICGKTFVKKQVLKRHFLMHQNNNEVRRRNSNSQPERDPESGRKRNRTEPTDATNSEPLDCYICGTNFVSKPELTSHLRKHKVNSCPTCGKTFNKKFVLKRHLQVHREKTVCNERHECAMCGKSYTRKDTLRRHMLLCARKFLDEIVVQNNAEKGLEEFIKNDASKNFTVEINIKEEMADDDDEDDDEDEEDDEDEY